MKKLAILLLPLFLLTGCFEDVPSNTSGYVRDHYREWVHHNNWECYAKFGRIWFRDYAITPDMKVAICYGQNSTGQPVEIFRSSFFINPDGKGYSTHHEPGQ